MPARAIILASRVRQRKRGGPALPAWDAPRQIMAQSVIQLSFHREPIG
jgi:hypothetical protein